MNNGFNRKKEILLVLSSWLVVMSLAFIKVWYGGMTVTTSNLLYMMPPFNIQGVSIEGPVLSDSIDSHLPDMYKLFTLGDMSIWDGMNAFGFPSTYNLLLNPFNLVFLLSFKYGILLNSILKYSMAYFGMYYFAKQLKLHPVAGVLAAVSYAFSSTMVMWHFWPHTDVMMLAPLMFAFGEKFMNKKGVYYVLAEALVVYWMIIAGMPTYAAYVIYLFGFYVLFRVIQIYGKDIKAIFLTYIKFGVAIVLGVAASLGYLYTLITMTVLNGYSDSRADQGYTSLEPKYLRSILMPYYRDGMEMHTTETTVFFGIAVMIIAAFFFIRMTKKKQWFWVISTTVVMLIAYTHLLDPVFNKMPGIHTSLKFRVITLVPFTLAVVAAIQLSDILENPEEYKNKWLRYIIYAVILGVWVVFKVTYPDVTKVFRNIIFVVMIAAAVEVLILVNKNAAKRIGCAVILLIASVNMGAFASEYMPLIEDDVPVIPTPTESIEYIQDNLKFRVFAGPDWTFFPRSNVYYGVRSITCHGFINTNKDVEKYLKSMDENMYVTRTNTHGSGITNVNLFKYAGIDKLLVIYPIDEQYSEDYEEVLYASDGLRVYSTDKFNDRFFIGYDVKTVDNDDAMLEYMKETYVQNGVVMLKSDYDASIASGEGSGSFSIVEDEGDYIKLDVNVDGNRVFVFDEYNEGNWKATIDGQDAKVLKVNYLFNAVIVPEGHHEVVFRYDTKIQNIFFICTVVIVLTLVLIMLILRIKNRKDRSEDETDNSDTVLQ